MAVSIAVNFQTLNFAVRKNKYGYRKLWKRRTEELSKIVTGNSDADCNKCESFIKGIYSFNQDEKIEVSFVATCKYSLIIKRTGEKVNINFNPNERIIQCNPISYLKPNSEITETIEFPDRKQILYELEDGYEHPGEYPEL